MLRNKSMVRVFFMVIVLSVIFVSMGLSAEKIEQYIPDAGAAETGMTLWQIIQAGGEIMVVLAVLSTVALGLIISYFLTIKHEALLPEEFLNKSLIYIKEKRYEDAKRACRIDRNFISNILLSGLLHVGQEKIIVKEAMQDEGRRNIDGLRQRLSYLSDIAAIAPMIGLLGTVLGMIQAFNVIAFQTGAVKPILLASGISKAMITTATGLMVAIPAMIFYSFFRGKVQGITAELENISTELYQLLAEKR